MTHEEGRGPGEGSRPSACGGGSGGRSVGGEGVAEGADELEGTRRVLEVDHLLVVAQLEAVEAGERELVGEEVVARELVGELGVAVW